MDEGLKFGRYSVRSILGTGAMSIVYEGFDSALERRVAIKTIRKDLLESDDAAQILERFRQEARIIARLRHRNFITVFELDEAWDPPFIAMELIASRNLAQLMRENYSFSPAQVAQIGQDLLAALHYLHQHKLIHRDVKPANLFWSPGEALKVADLGVAHVRSSTLTELGSTVGTPAYMAPEQIRGEDVDARIDLWAAGVVLFELLSGTRCFKGDHDTVRQAVLHGDPFLLPLAVERIQGSAFEPILRRALAKDREQRYASAAEFSQALAPLGAQLDKAADLADSAHHSQGEDSVRRAPGGAQIDGEDDDATVLAAPAKRAVTGNHPIAALKAGQGRRIGVAALAVLLLAGGYWAWTAMRTAPPSTTSAELAEQVRKTLGAVQCADLQYAIENSLVKVSGFVPNQESKDSLQAKLEKLVGSDQLSLFTETRPWPFCDVMQTIKPFGKGQSRAASGMHIRVENYSGQLLEGDIVNLAMVTPGFDAHLYVDYFQGDRNVVHLLPAAGPLSAPTKTSTAFKLEAGQVGSPFGDEMVVMVASKTPLFPAQRPEYEPADQYLAALKEALQKTAKDDVVADYMFIKTAKK